MAGRTIGLLHPGEMGSAVGAALRGRGHTVLWVAEGRSDATRERARADGLEAVDQLAELAERAEVVLSICPPHAALDVVSSLGDFAGGIYVDANAVSPETVRGVAALAGAAGARTVDGGIIGGPPLEPGTRLYLSGPDAVEVAELFAGSPLEAVVVDGELGAASALKAAYAAWTKTTAALLLSIRALARAEGVDAELLAEWERSQPGLVEHCGRAAHSASTKGWRWVGEMEEIAAALETHGLPSGFLHGAAEVFDRSPRVDGGAPLDDVVASLARPEG